MIRYTIQLPPLPGMELTSRRVKVTLNGCATVFRLEPDATTFAFEAHADDHVIVSMQDEAGIERFSPVSPVLEFDSSERPIPPQPGPMSIVGQETV